jgi:hypothetical protein
MDSDFFCQQQYKTAKYCDLKNGKKITQIHPGTDVMITIFCYF